MPNGIIKSLSRKTGTPIAEVERLWAKSISIIKKKTSVDDKSFYPLVVGTLKKMLKIKKESLLKTPANLILDVYDDGGTKHRLRAEPIGSASTIFKRNKFLSRRDKRDKERNKKKKSKQQESKLQDNLSKKFGITKFGPGSIGMNEDDGIWYGWSYRAIHGFKIGDKVFEPDFGDDNTHFSKHGKKTIKNMEDAKLAATRFSDYVS